MSADSGGEPPGTPDDGDDEEEQPDIADDEVADLSAVAEQVEAEAGSAAGDEAADQADAEEPTLDPDADRVSIGDVYCNVLGMGAAVARDRYGSGLEQDRKDALDEYAEIARDLEIDQAVDDWLEAHGGPDQLTPGQTIIVMTVVWGGMVVMEDPAIIEGVADATEGNDD